ncbi:SPOR domain-containing protein [Halomonas shantousis]
MKYGMRERISGALILAALGAIFLPMLFDEPTPRGERPEPVLTIEQPIPVDRKPVAAPEPPASLDRPVTAVPQAREQQPPAVTDLPSSPPEATATASSSETESRSSTPSSEADPIAEIAQSKAASKTSKPSTSIASDSDGEWAVQVGSFGKSDNAERLTQQLKEQGFTAYRQSRDNNLTTVYVGPFASSETGEQARAELKQKANIQGLLIRIKE